MRDGAARDGNEASRPRVPAGTPEDQTLPRYHFDLVDSETVTDEGGADLPDDIQALDVAEEIARRLLEQRPELKGRHFSILVTNEDGEEIGRMPLDVVH